MALSKELICNGFATQLWFAEILFLYPAEKKPLHLALELLKHHPAKAVTAHMVDGKTTVQEVDESV